MMKEAEAIAGVVNVVVVAVLVVLVASRGSRKRAEASRSPLYDSSSKFSTHTCTHTQTTKSKQNKSGAERKDGGEGATRIALNDKKKLKLKE